MAARRRRARPAAPFPFSSTQGGLVEREVQVGVLASGRGSNFEALWRAQAAGRLGARLVCLATDNPRARALSLAASFGLATLCVGAGERRGRLTPRCEGELVDFLRAQRVDLVCLAGFMRLLGATMLAAFPGAILNIHPSLLPAFPGLGAQRQALEHGVKIAGCTVHFVDAGVDTGAIVAQAAVEVRDDDSEATLAARILEREHEIYPRAVRLWAEGRLHVQGRRVTIAAAGSGGAVQEARS
jgi:phosphoribosylglycinamide formyltransferase-1